MTRRIITSYFRVPGPAPQFDWTAYYEGTEETGPYGSGPNPQAAINDLVDNYETEFGDEPAPILVLCETCQSEGRILRSRGGPDDIDCGECPDCEGSGQLLVDSEPATQEDREQEAAQ